MVPAARDDVRFEQEALCWLPDVSRFALSLTRGEADADDLVQDTFLIAYQKWNQYVPGSACRAWLFTICRHQFYRTRERGERLVEADTPELEALAAAAIHASAQSAGLEDSFERAEVLAAVEHAIAALPAAYRDVALLVDVHEHSYDSASMVLGVPVGTVRSRLFRARRLLQEKLLAHARDAGFAGRGAGPRSRGPLS
ncbi:MAG TPA: sigma-70 family RNA polymerase sigma factor [Gemmatimonadaceae bacterium]|nr:sigma-70 family RNA polymerase sigma factor [Gemmatimonadaceae bacterium]